MVKGFEFVNIDTAGNIEVPGVNIVGHTDQFSGLIGGGIGEEFGQILSDTIQQSSQSAAGICGLSGGPQHIDEGFGSNVVALVGEQIGDQQEVCQSAFLRSGQRIKIVSDAKVTEHFDF